MSMIFTKTKSFVSGFALPTIMIASLVMLMVLLSSATSTSSVNMALKTQNYNQLAKSAADAGLAYARACLNVNGNRVTWTNSSPLRPDTDCAGIQLASCPTIPADVACHFVMSNDMDNDNKVDITSVFEVSSPISNLNSIIAWKQVDSGNYHTCALTTDNLVYCWGRNYYGQIGDNTSGTDRMAPTAVNMANGVSGLYGKTVQQITAGDNHTCALTTDNLVYCWGYNNYGQIGDNTSGTNRLAPTAVNMANGVSGLYGKTVQQITAGGNHTCALTTDNLVYCWGYNGSGQIGDNTSGTSRLAPTAVNTANGVSGLYGKTVQQIAAGGTHTCALTTDNLVYCWGSNSYGQIGDNTSGTNRLAPTAVNTANGVSGLYGKTVQQITTSTFNTCALATDGLVFCWGGNGTGQIGDNTSGTNRLAPTAVNTANGVSGLYGKTVQQITAGHYQHTCALTDDDLVYCWGFNDTGQIGNNNDDRLSRLVPTAVNMANGVSGLYGKTVQQITAGYSHSCALTDDGLVYCWGNNYYGQIGNIFVGKDKFIVPIAVNTTNGVSGLYGKTVQQISAGGQHTCAIASDDLVYCWGYNNHGQIGDNTSGTNRLAPTAVNTANGVSGLYGKTAQQVAVGSYHTCALTTDNLVYCWGYNDTGQIGDNTSDTDRLVPTAVNTTNGVSGLYGKTVQQVTAGGNHTCALTTDNLVYCWGYDGNGQLGNDTVYSGEYAPTAVNTTNGVSGLYGKTVQQITAGYSHSCALTNDGLVYCWGSNSYGQIGDNTSGTNRLVPTAVNTASGVSALYGKTVQQVVAGENHTCALTTDNIIACWGRNNLGQIGDNTSGTNRLAPTAVNTASGVSALYGKTVQQVVAGDIHNCALSTDGLVYCWGYGVEGQIGNNAMGSRLVPTAVNTASGVSALYDKTVQQITAGVRNTCALSNDDLVYCWGGSNRGKIGNGLIANAIAPIETISNESAATIFDKIISTGIAKKLRSDGTVWRQYTHNSAWFRTIP